MTTFDWSLYTGNLVWLPSRTLYMTRHGSHAYGTSTPESDVDVRGVCVAPMQYCLGFSKAFEQVVQNQPVDLTVFELRKFMKLASDANPNTLEILYTDPSDHLLVRPPMERLLDSRDLFLSKKVKHTFSGYSRAQMKRINTHYRWLKNPPLAPPTRAEFDLPERTVIPADQLDAAESAVKKQVDRWSWHELEHLDPAARQAMQDEFTRRLLEITQWSWDEVNEKLYHTAAKSVGYDANFIEYLDMERRYTARLREWQHYQDWKTKRNPKRAELEAKFGYDCKHAYHLIRLARMCREIITTGQVIVKRQDAEELLQIRNGAWTYEQLVEFSDKQDKELDELVKTSKLPKQPNKEKLDQLCMEIIQAVP